MLTRSRVTHVNRLFVATLKELRRSSVIAQQPFSGFASSVNGARLPSVVKAQRYHPVRDARMGTRSWAGISERFQR